MITFRLKDECHSIYTLNVLANNALGTGDVRIILPDGTTVSEACFEVETLTDGSEVFQVVLS